MYSESTDCTVQLKVVDAVVPSALCTVAVMLVVPTVVGVPLITPVEPFSDRPAGRAVEVQVYGVKPPPPFKVRLAEVLTGVVWPPGLLRKTGVGGMNAA